MQLSQTEPVRAPDLPPSPRRLCPHFSSAQSRSLAPGPTRQGASRGHCLAHADGAGRASARGAELSHVGPLGLPSLTQSPAACHRGTGADPHPRAPPAPLQLGAYLFHLVAPELRGHRAAERRSVLEMWRGRDTPGDQQPFTQQQLPALPLRSLPHPSAPFGRSRPREPAAAQPCPLPGLPQPQQRLLSSPAGGCCWSSAPLWQLELLGAGSCHQLRPEARAPHGLVPGAQVSGARALPGCATSCSAQLQPPRALAGCCLGARLQLPAPSRCPQPQGHSLAAQTAAAAGIWLQDRRQQQAQHREGEAEHTGPGLGLP